MKLKKGMRDYKVQAIGILVALLAERDGMCFRVTQVDALGMARLQSSDLKSSAPLQGFPTHAMLVPPSSMRTFFMLRVWPEPDRDYTMTIKYHPPMKEM